MEKEEFDEVLTNSVEDQITDIIFAVEEYPLWRVGNSLMEVKREHRLTAEDTDMIARILLEPAYEDIDSLNEAEVAYEIKDVGRFRAAIFRQRGVFRIVVRVIPMEIRTFEELNLPEQIKQISELERGLILVTGATGQGKSTTISAIIEQINRTRKAHIITIEDPIEFIYGKARSVVTQRELREDVNSYEVALRSALRHSPDVIMIGEIRDAATFEAVLTAAETGHLVISAIHSADAKRTFNHVLRFYNHEERENTTERLVNNLAAIVSLRLLQRKKGIGRIPAVEILRMNDAIADCLRKKDNLSDIENYMKKGNDYYRMQTFDNHIIELYSKGLIEKDIAIKAATRPAEVERAMTLAGEELKGLEVTR